MAGLKNSRGQGMVEYILIVALIAVIALAGIKLFGKNVTEMFSGAADKIQNETEDSGIN